MRYNGFHTGTAVQHAYALGSAPSFLSASGTLEAGYKLSAATRDGRLHALRGGEAPGAAVQLEAQPVGLVRRGSGRAQATIPRAFPHPAATRRLQASNTDTQVCLKCFNRCASATACWSRRWLTWCTATAARAVPHGSTACSSPRRCSACSCWRRTRAGRQSACWWRSQTVGPQAARAPQLPLLLACAAAGQAPACTHSHTLHTHTQLTHT